MRQTSINASLRVEECNDVFPGLCYGIRSSRTDQPLSGDFVYSSLAAEIEQDGRLVGTLESAGVFSHDILRATCWREAKELVEEYDSELNPLLTCLILLDLATASPLPCIPTE